MSRLARSAALVSAALLAACGGGPAAPSGVNTAAVVLHGVVQGSTASGMSAHSASAATPTIVVTVQQQPSLSTTVLSDGTFTLSGLPTGSFTLLFSVNGAPAGSLTFSQVTPGAQITIVVIVASSNVSLVSENRDGHDEGPSPSPSPSATPTPSPSPAACVVEGGRVGDGIELEGTVASGDSSSFELNVNGNRASQFVDVDASGASFQCSPASGPNAPTLEQCKAKVKTGTQVNVNGTLTACDASSAKVRASKVIVQK